MCVCPCAPPPPPSPLTGDRVPPDGGDSSLIPFQQETVEVGGLGREDVSTEKKLKKVRTIVSVRLLRDGEKIEIKKSLFLKCVVRPNPHAFLLKFAGYLVVKIDFKKTLCFDSDNLSGKQQREFFVDTRR